MKLRDIIISVASASLLLVSLQTMDFNIPATGKRISTKLKAPPKSSYDPDRKNRIYSSQKEEFEEVAKRLTFLGYDKKTSSAKESFFVENGSETPLSSIELEITYFTTAGKQIHKRTVELKEAFTPGDSKKVDIPSWDTQKSFHYLKSTPSKNGSTPYSVRFRVLSFKKSD